MLSEIEAISRKIGQAFSKAGLKKGHVVEFVIPNSTLYHVLVFGAWLCGATVSLGDPEMSLSALKTQLIDTQAIIKGPIIYSIKGRSLLRHKWRFYI